ncbi:PREDICTED: AT-hook motif nuclear-localized protein 10-like isoform X1 [Ipomoea nil]|uniref:AT-hook motif nuclear-localized protein 10-like isoform X1 n=1 Tax=Ipomoea nil TaxID=35883 RepID=UPI0009016644|nr:PREDICTED: AT-hook motif nuclear-localized protein 10-like isoform X1 [Ipomoea nil]
MSLGESNGVHGLGSSFLEDGTPMYNLMMPPPVSSSPSSYQLPAGGEPPLITSAQPSLNPSAPEPAVKKKRGRPRKYAPDGSANAAIISPPPPPPLAVQSAAGGSLSPTGAAAAETAAASPKKKGRGRPPGSGRKNQMAAASLGSAGAGFGFKPHVVTIKAGEDVQAKLMSFSQNTSQAICILSANGAISNVTLRQAATSGGTVTYEGRFEILSLSGSFLLSELGGQRSRTGGLSVSLAGPDGHVLGGCVAGLLTAASPVQVIVGSFSIEVHQQQAGNCEGLASPGMLISGGAAKSPPSLGTLSASSGGGPVSPHNHHLETSNSSPSGIASIQWR